MNPQLVYLTQTETTAGFLSQNSLALANSKQRDPAQSFIRCVDSLKTLKQFTRVPKKFKNRVRRAVKTTLIYPNGEALRVVKDKEHLKLLRKLRWAYSSSANLTTQPFNELYARQRADILIEDKRGFFQSTPSSMIKINNKTARRVR